MEHLSQGGTERREVGVRVPPRPSFAGFRIPSTLLLVYFYDTFAICNLVAQTATPYIEEHKILEGTDKSSPATRGRVGCTVDRSWLGVMRTGGRAAAGRTIDCVKGHSE